MSSTAEDQARAIGFLNPQVVNVHLRRGETFTVRGMAKNGFPYELRHTIESFDQTSIVLNVEGEFGNQNKLAGNRIKFQLVPNRPFKIPQVVRFGQSDIYIAFIAPSASQFRPIEAGILTVALGEVRDTVPPPPPKK